MSFGYSLSDGNGFSVGGWLTLQDTSASERIVNIVFIGRERRFDTPSTPLNGWRINLCYLANWWTGHDSKRASFHPPTSKSVFIKLQPLVCAEGIEPP